MVGVRFRYQGRDPVLGLDCVGLIVAAYAVAGRLLPSPCDYPLRGWRRPRILQLLQDAGFAEASDAPRAGDVGLFPLAAGQFHLGLIGAASVVHAHAGLRRVVETPFDAWTIGATRWRLKR